MSNESDKVISEMHTMTMSLNSKAQRIGTIISKDKSKLKLIDDMVNNSLDTTKEQSRVLDTIMKSKFSTIATNLTTLIYSIGAYILTLLIIKMVPLNS
jgi:hypothetical protein